jgi:hypothetical protein
VSAWVLIPCLIDLRGEFNEVSPNRDKGADGSIGDGAHTSSSDHTPDEDSRILRDHDADSKNEVHALDVDSSGPWPGSGTQKARFHRIVMRVIAAEKIKWKSSSDRCRLNYVIWDGKIYDKDNDFVPVAYDGSDPHTNHAHFSGRYETSCENDRRPWGVVVIKPKPEEDDVSAEDVTKALETPRPYKLARIKERGWAEISLSHKIDYIFEALVANGLVAADPDGVIDDSGSVQARLSRIEGALSRLEHPGTPGA